MFTYIYVYGYVQKCYLHGPPPGGVILAAWEILFPQKSGCKDVTA